MATHRRINHGGERDADRVGAQVVRGRGARRPVLAGRSPIAATLDGGRDGTAIDPAAVPGLSRDEAAAIRIHSSRDTALAAAALDARAFGIGRDLFFARSDDADPTSAVFAHELGHAVGHSTPRLARHPDPTRGVIEPSTILLSSNDDLVAMEQAVVDLWPMLDDTQRSDVWLNLGRIQAQMRDRKLPVQQLGFARTTADATGRASLPEITALEAMIDTLLTQARTELGTTVTSGLATWLEHERTQVQQIAATAVVAEGDLFEVMLETLDKIITIRRAVPTEPALDPDVATAQQGVDRATEVALDALPTSARRERLVELVGAVEHFVDVYSASVIKALAGARDAVKALPNAVDAKDKVPDFKSDDAFIMGYNSSEGAFIALDTSSVQYDIWRLKREEYLELFDRLGALDPAAPLPERVAFLKAYEQRAPAIMRNVEGLVILSAALVMGRGYMDLLTEKTNQITIESLLPARALKMAVVDPLAQTLGHLKDDDIAHYRAELTEIGDRMQRHFDDAKDYLEKVNAMMTIAVIVASLYFGGVGMRAAVGADVGAIGTTAMTTSTLVRGALGFSLASQMTSTLLTGQAPTLQEALFQTSMDLVTFGLMHSVNLKLAGVFGSPAQVPVLTRMTAEFSALWAWSTAAGIGTQLLTSGTITADQVLQIAYDAEKHTAVGFMAMGVVHHMSQAPTLGTTPGTDPALEAARRTALEAYEQLRLEGKELDEQIKKRAESGESTTELDVLLEKAEAWYGKFGLALDNLAAAGVMEIAGAKAIQAELAGHAKNIRSIRDAARLGLRAATSRTVAYSAESGDLAMYLSRLQSEGMIKEFIRVGDAGLFRVTMPDGTSSYWYPEAAPTEAGRGIDFAEQYLREAHPELSTDAQARIIHALRTAAGADVPTLVHALTEPWGAELVEWLERPAVTAALEGSARGGEFLNLVAADYDLRTRAPSEGEALLWWHELPFELIYGDRSAASFKSLLADAKAYGADLGGGLETAKEVFAYLRDAHPAVAFDVVGAYASQAPDPTPRKAMADEIMSNRIPGDFFVSEGADGTRFLQVVDGKLQTSYHYAPGATRPTTVDIAAGVELMAGAREMAIADPSMTGTYAAAMKSTVEKLEFIRELRGVETAEINKLLDLWSLRFTSHVEPTITPAPSPAEAPTVAAVTSRSRLGRARAEVLERAHRMGLFSDPATLDPSLVALDAWKPGDITTQPADPGAVIEAARAVLEIEADRAVKQAKRYFGAGNVKKMRGEFVNDAAAQDVLRLTHGMHARTPEMMRGLALATQPAPPGETSSPIPIESLFENAPSARDARLVFEMFAKLRDANIPGAHRLLRDMAASKKAFRGGLFTMRAVADGRIPLSEIAALEAPEAITIDIDGVATEVGRRYDVVLKSGERLELKSWTRFLRDKIRLQFGKDVVIRTDNFKDPLAIRHMRWLFEELPTVTEGAPPRTRTLTDAEARELILAEMELAIADQRTLLGRSWAEVEPVLEQLRWHAHRIINIGVLRP